jgi:uncharacterized cupredoxin-like copper-binding protein
MKQIKFLSLLFLIIFQNSYATMQMDEKGMVMNSNSDNLPKDCPKISETVNLTVHAGHKYAEKFNGKMFAFDQQQWDVKPCAKINITFVNDDQIRHQFMIHGLPGYLYPDGMLHLELYGQGELHASLIVPSIKKTYLVHCELAQHAEKGMKSQLKVEGGDGDLSSISGISVAINTDDYMLDWSFLKLGGLVICIVILMIIYFGNKLFLKAFCYSR